MILSQVRILCDMTDSEKLKWMENVKPIIEYNRKHLDTYIKEHNE